MGRPSKNNVQKALAGSKVGPELRPGMPAKPTGLSDRASREWDLLSSELAEAGLQISVAHRAPLAIAATIAADIAEAWEPIQRMVLT